MWYRVSLPRSRPTAAEFELRALHEDSARARVAGYLKANLFLGLTVDVEGLFPDICEATQLPAAEQAYNDHLYSKIPGDHDIRLVGFTESNKPEPKDPEESTRKLRYKRMWRDDDVEPKEQVWVQDELFETVVDPNGQSMAERYKPDIQYICTPIEPLTLFEQPKSDIMA